jgi:hypothetical protein
MSETKHTPGPWTVEDPMGAEIGLSIVQADLDSRDWEFIAMVCQSDPSEEHMGRDRFISPEEQGANARVIAAAPEMLNALKAIQKIGVLNPTNSMHVRKAIADMVAAIKKADGRS